MAREVGEVCKEKPQVSVVKGEEGLDWVSWWRRERTGRVVEVRWKLVPGPSTFDQGFWKGRVARGS